MSRLDCEHPTYAAGLASSTFYDSALKWFVKLRLDHFPERRSWLPCKGAALVALALAGCHPSSSAQKDGSWATFNGFYPGMSLQDAKAAGAHDCKETSAISREIQCSIPAERLALGGLVAREGSLQFYVRHEHRLSRMLLYFRGTHYDGVCQVLANAYGIPVNGIVYAWHRNRTPAVIRSNKRALSDPKSSLVEFLFEPKFAAPENDMSLSDPRGCLQP